MFCSDDQPEFKSGFWFEAIFFRMHNKFSLLLADLWWEFCRNDYIFIHCIKAIHYIESRLECCSNCGGRHYWHYSTGSLSFSQAAPMKSCTTGLHLLPQIQGNFSNLYDRVPLTDSNPRNNHQVIWPIQLPGSSIRWNCMYWIAC